MICAGIVVSVAVLEGGDRVSFSVTDDGRGLPPGVTQEALFLDFNAAAAGAAGQNSNRAVHSTGLGLPICHR